MVALIGGRLQEAREARGLSRKQLAAKLSIDGNDLRRWEEGATAEVDVPSAVLFGLLDCLRFPLRFYTRPLTIHQPQHIFFCGPGVDASWYCRYCGAMSESLCDWPIGSGVTCDLPLCEAHRTHVADGPDPDGEYDIDYCPTHAAMAAK